MQGQIFTGPAVRQVELLAEPDDAVVVGQTGGFPGDWQLHGLPVGRVKLGFAPVMRGAGIVFGVPVGDPLVEAAAAFFHLGIGLLDGIDLRNEVGHGAEGGGADPGLRDGAAPGGVNQPDRDMLRLLKMPPEEVADRAESAPAPCGYALRGAILPVADDEVLRLPSDLLRHAEQANVGVGGFGDLIRRVVDLADAHLHVRLSGADPDIADQYIFDFGLFRAVDGERVGASCREGAEGSRPFAVRAGGSAGSLAVHADGDLLAGLRPAPYRGFDAALKHHVIRKQWVQVGFCLLRLAGLRLSEDQQGQQGCYQRHTPECE